MIPAGVAWQPASRHLRPVRPMASSAAACHRLVQCVASLNRGPRQLHELLLLRSCCRCWGSSSASRAASSCRSGCARLTPHSSEAICAKAPAPRARASALYGPCGAVALASGLALTGSANVSRVANASRVALPSAVARPLKRRLENRHIDSTTEEESDDSDESDGDSATARVSSSASTGGPSAAAPAARWRALCT